MSHQVIYQIAKCILYYIPYYFVPAEEDDSSIMSMSSCEGSVGCGTGSESENSEQSQSECVPVKKRNTQRVLRVVMKTVSHVVPKKTKVLKEEILRGETVLEEEKSS